MVIVLHLVTFYATAFTILPSAYFFATIRRSFYGKGTNNESRLVAISCFLSDLPAPVSKDTNGDGIGDLQGIIDELDYLVEFGADAIWLSPFYPSPMKDFGYDVADYCDVDPMFGNLEQMDQLIAEAHKRNIRVVVDYVPNHTSDEHEWFIESSSSRDNPKADWYIWKDPKPDGSLPNNWGSIFGGVAWTWNEARQQYYFHQFDPGQPDLNWRNPDVKKAMLDVLRFWMKRGIDGFRMDVVNMIWKHPDMPDQPIIEGATGRGENDLFSTQQQIYSFDYDGIHDVMKELRATLDEFGDRVMIGEIWLPLEKRLAYHGDGDEFHMPFNFGLLAGPDFQRIQWKSGGIRTAVDNYEAALKDDQWPNYVLGNHDVPRLASRIGESQTRNAAMLLLTLRGTPTLYNGDEIGMINGDITEADVQDPQGIRLGLAATRDVCRTPTQWDDSSFAGFSPDGTESTWLPVTYDYKERNIKAQVADNQSLWSLYHKLIAIRRDSDALLAGKYTSLDSTEGCFVYLREAKNERYCIALNFTDEDKSVTLPSSGTLVLSSMLDDPDSLSDGVVALRPNEGVLVQIS